MCQCLKQSTAITQRAGPFVDITDGLTLETGLVLDRSDTRLSKAGGDFVQKTETTSATHDENGWYLFLLDATDTDTLGMLTVNFIDAGARPVSLQFMVVPANVWDSMFGSDLLKTDMNEVAGASQTAGDLQVDIAAVKGVADAVLVDTGTTLPDQIGGIGASSGGSVNIEASEDNTGGAIIDSVTFVGSVQGATTFANTEAEDGVYHDIDDTGDDIDIVYGFSVGGGRVATEVIFAGFVQGSSDEMKIKVFDHVGSDWEIIGTLPGTNGTVNTVLTLPLLLKHTGTSASELGKVYIRFEKDGTTPSNLSVDELLVEAVNVGNTVGYASGAVWVDTVTGVAGTESFVNGVADNPVDLFASAITIAAAVDLHQYEMTPASAITLAATINSSVLDGKGWTLALGGQDIDDLHVFGAGVTGVGTSATRCGFHDCKFGTASIQKAFVENSTFNGTVTMTLAGDYSFVNCQSAVAGAGAPTFAKTAGQAITAAWRNWSGGITFSGLEAGDVLTVSGELGTIDLGSPAGAVAIDIRGTYKAITNVGSAVVNTDGAIKGVDVASILDDTGTAGVKLHATQPSGWPDNLATSAATMIKGLVDDTAFAPTTTEFESDTFTEATADHFNDSLIQWSEGSVMAGQRVEIVSYALVGGRGHFTVTAMTEAPPNNAPFQSV